MDSNSTSQHISQKFDEEMEDLRNQVLKMGGLVEQQISGAMDRAGPYFERSNRRLSTETGGSGNLFERMERNRELALQRRKEKRRDEDRDEARRQRARRNKGKEN